MAPILTPCFRASMATALGPARGLKSQRTWTATVGQQPVTRWTSPASASLSFRSMAAASWKNLPNRVPVSAKPQEGVSIAKFSSAVTARRSSLGVMGRSILARRPRFVTREIAGEPAARSRPENSAQAAQAQTNQSPWAT